MLAQFVAADEFDHFCIILNLVQ